MINMAQSVAESMGASCEFNTVEGYPALFNDPEITTKSANYAREYLGQEAVEDLVLQVLKEMQLM